MSRPAPSSADDPAKRLSRLLFWFLLVAGSGLIITAALPYPTIRPLGDALSRDGSLELLTPSRWAALQTLLGGGGVFFLILAFLIRCYPRTVFSVLKWLRGNLTTGLQNLPADAQAALKDGLHSLRQREFWLPALLLFLLGLILRIFFVHVPMEHDEAYTFSVFAIQPLRLGLSDYHYPNNHLFHTLLVHLSYRLFGIQPWTVRLPALLAGSLLAPFGYWLARRLYTAEAARLAGLSIALAPVLVDYSVNARGYTLLALFTLWNFTLAVSLSRKGNFFLWFLLAIFGALGLYTVPVFVYSLAMVYFWMAFVWLSGRLPPVRRATFPLALFVSGSLTLTLAGLFYLPVFLNSGVSAVIANQWIEPVAREWFLPTLQSRLSETWQEWTHAVHPVLVGLYLIGWFAGCFFHRRLSTLSVPLQVGLLVLPVVVFIQRPNPWAKIWLFLVPLMLLWASAGLAFLLQNVLPLRWRKSALVVIALVMLASSGIWVSQQAPVGEKRYGDVEQAVRYLKSEIQKGDIVIITAPEDAPLWYYFYQYELPQELIRRDVPFRRAFVLVSTAHQQTLEQVIRERGPDYGFFDFTTVQRLAGFGHMDVYLVEADHQAIERYYGSSTP